MITGKTIVCGLIGDPVEHSMSPVMHNSVFREFNLNYAYLPFRVNNESLESAIRGMRALGIRGLNVTIPHKIAVLPMLDKVDNMALKIGAVNTIVNDEGILSGYNTDAEGFIQSLAEKKIDPTGKYTVLVGAGGAARAVAFALVEKKAKLVIMNRSPEKAQRLAEQLFNQFSTEVKAIPLNDINTEIEFKTAEIVINTTSVGMHPNKEGTPIAARYLRKGTVVYDVVYNPIKTRLLKESEKAGAVTIGGVDMLAWQGALAFEKWTGKKAPIQLMKNTIIQHLETDEN